MNCWCQKWSNRSPRLVDPIDWTRVVYDRQVCHDVLCVDKKTYSLQEDHLKFLTELIKPTYPFVMFL